MKYIKKFEAIKEDAPKYKVDDIVVFTPLENMTNDFSNHLARVNRVDNFSNTTVLQKKQRDIYYSMSPLGYIDKSKSKYVTTNLSLYYPESKIKRKATEQDIKDIEIKKDAQKYNL